MGDRIQERHDRVMTDATQIAETYKVQGDTDNRFQQRPTGEMEFGTGSATPDVNLKRLGVNVVGTSYGLGEGVEAASTGEGATIQNYGLSLIASSSAKSLLLENPTVAGMMKSIHCTNGSSTNAIISLFTSSTSVAFDANGSSGTTPLRKILFDNSGGQSEGVTLRSYARATDGTLMWGIVGAIGTSGPVTT